MIRKKTFRLGCLLAMIAFVALPSAMNAARVRARKVSVNAECVQGVTLKKKQGLRAAAQLLHMAQLQARKDKKNRRMFLQAKGQYVLSVKAINAAYMKDRATCRIAVRSSRATPVPVSSSNLVPLVSSNPTVGTRESAPSSVSIRINGNAVTQEQLDAFRKLYGKEPVAGEYWYDARSGLYGAVGGPSIGYMAAGLDFGPLPPHASNGDTGVSINGREIPQSEWLLLSQLVGTYVQKGSYWVDANGNAGIEGDSTPIVNLFASSARGGGGSSDHFWSTNFSAGNSNAEGQGYVSVPGYGPVGYGF